MVKPLSSASWSSEKLAIAPHEAGHAVAAIALHVGFRWVSVEEDKESLSRVYHGELTPKQLERIDLAVYPSLRDARTRRLVEDHIMITLAGAETASHVAGRPVEEGSGVGAPLAQAEADELNAPKQGVVRAGQPIQAGDRLLDPRGDFAEAVQLASRVCDTDDETIAYLEWLRQRTLNLIRDKTFEARVRL